MLGRVLLNGSKGKSPFPSGFKLCIGEHPTFKGTGTVPYDKSKFIPLVITMGSVMSKEWAGNTQTHLYMTVNDKSVQYLYCQPRTSYSVGTVSITNYTGSSIDLISFNGGFESLSKLAQLKTNFTFTCTMWLEKFGGGSIDSLNTFLRKLVNTMFGRVHINSKGFFPAGYKLVQGELVKSIGSNPLNIPAGVIPLSIKHEGHVIQENRSASATCVLTANGNISKQILSYKGYANEQARDDADCRTTVDLAQLYSYNFDMLKSIRSISLSVSGFLTTTPSPIVSTTAVVVWLQPIGGNS